MAGEGELVIVQRPDVNIVHLMNTLDLLEPVANVVRVEVRGHRLEDQFHALPEGHTGGVKNDDSEKVCADRVHPPALRPDENNYCGNDDSDRVEQIAKNM